MTTGGRKEEGREDFNIIFNFFLGDKYQRQKETEKIVCFLLKVYFCPLPSIFCLEGCPGRFLINIIKDSLFNLLLSFLRVISINANDRMTEKV